MNLPPTKAQLLAVLTLAEIAKDGCSQFHSGTTCWTAGKNPASKYGADRVCDACLARAALDALANEGADTP